MPPRPSFRKGAETNPPGLVDAERKILDVIRSKEESGILLRDIKQAIKLNDNVVKKALDSLLGKRTIKEVVSAQNKRNKLFMGAEFQPSDQITGGDWYEDGSLNQELISALKQLCRRFISSQKVATLESLHNDVKKSGVLSFSISSQHVGQILDSMVLDNDVIEVKSSGYGDYHSIPIGTMCYRAAGAARGSKVGVFASIPCGGCTRISLCSPHGTVSPATCVYYNKWLNIDF